jgi:hypothetical protein
MFQTISPPKRIYLAAIRSHAHRKFVVFLCRFPNRSLTLPFHFFPFDFVLLLVPPVGAIACQSEFASRTLLM